MVGRFAALILVALSTLYAHIHDEDAVEKEGFCYTKSSDTCLKLGLRTFGQSSFWRYSKTNGVNNEGSGRIDQDSNGTSHSGQIGEVDPPHKRLRLSLQTLSEDALQTDPEVTAFWRQINRRPVVMELPGFLDEDEVKLTLSLATRKRNHDKRQCDLFSVLSRFSSKTLKKWDLDGDTCLSLEEMQLSDGLEDMKDTNEVWRKMSAYLGTTPPDGCLRYKDVTEEEIGQLRDILLHHLNASTDAARSSTLHTTWIWHDKDELLRYQEVAFYDLHERISSLMGVPVDVVADSEPVQAIKIKSGQNMFCREDSDPISSLPCCIYGETKNCRLCRYATLLMFLNDDFQGGEIVFPLGIDKGMEFDRVVKWEGFYVYKNTTGGANFFSTDLTFHLNRTITGVGLDDGGNFEVTGSTDSADGIQFEKIYTENRGTVAWVKYSGFFVDVSRVEGLWWVPGRPKLQGQFYMWNFDEELANKKRLRLCHRSKFDSSALRVRPETGKAVLWFNHDLDPRGWVGDLAPRVQYGVSAVSGTDMWVALFRVNVIGDGVSHVTSWRRGSNLISKIGDELSTDPPHKVDDGSATPTRLQTLQRIIEIETDASSDIARRSHPKARSVSSEMRMAIEQLIDALPKDLMNILTIYVHQRLGITCIPMIQIPN